jgi:hypothetical protein
MPNHESEPTFFSFVDAAIIWTNLYDGLPFHEFGPKIYLIEFAAQALEDPKAEPIAVYHYAGIRRYFWRSRYWSEYDAHAPYLDYRKLLDMLKSYARRSWIVGNSGHDIADIPFSGQHHTAIVYPIR